MRPTTALWSPRPGEADDKAPTAAPPPPEPEHRQKPTYYLLDESAMEAAEAAGTSSTPSPQATPHQPKDILRDSSFGVQSLSDTMHAGLSKSSALSSEESPAKDEDRRGPEPHDDELPSDTILRAPEAEAIATTQPSSTEDILSSTSTKRASPYVASRLSPSPVPSSSVLSSPKSISAHSLQNLDLDSNADDGGSQAIMSSEDEDNELPSEIQDSAPQLIMPSIKMPSRRPFTERGKTMGKLKVLFAGESGTGKTSLIKSIVQTCEDIVHVDPLSSSTPFLDTISTRTGRRKSKGPQPTSTSQITEVYASTKPYPAWWSEFDDTKVLRRRKSLGDSVLERNLCFIDTPGYVHGPSAMDSIEPVVRYVEGQFERMGSLVHMSDGDLMRLLSGAGGSQIDVVFYVISQKLKREDLDYMKRLAPLTNIIPIITHADRLHDGEITALKTALEEEMQDAGISPFLCERIDERDTHPSITRPPFAVSSAISNDADTMDASLLMSPDYVQPLVASELTTLVDRVFERDMVAWLRHRAAKKFVHWWRGSLSASLINASPGHTSSVGSSAFALISASGGSSAMLSPSLAPSSPGYASSGQSPSYALARVADHTQREDRIAKVRLAKWASDLQRSFQNERDRFERVARGERAVWLTGRLEECILDGSIEPLALEQNLQSHARSSTTMVARSSDSKTMRGRSGSRARVDAQDPLGLLQMREQLRSKGWVTLQVVGGFGILGGIAVWIARYWAGDAADVMDWSWWGRNEG